VTDPDPRVAGSKPNAAGPKDVLAIMLVAA
jgi:hypothetical protein